MAYRGPQRFAPKPVETANVSEESRTFVPTDFCPVGIGGTRGKDTSKTKIFVGNLPKSVTSHKLFDFFVRFGDIREAVVIPDRFRVRSRGYGFVTFVCESSVSSVFDSIAYKDLFYDGKKLSIRLACRGERPRRAHFMVKHGSNGHKLLNELSPSQQRAGGKTIHDNFCMYRTANIQSIDAVSVNRIREMAADLDLRSFQVTALNRLAQSQGMPPIQQPRLRPNLSGRSSSSVVSSMSSVSPVPPPPSVAPESSPAFWAVTPTEPSETAVNAAYVMRPSAEKQHRGMSAWCQRRQTAPIEVSIPPRFASVHTQRRSSKNDGVGRASRGRHSPNSPNYQKTRRLVGSPFPNEDIERDYHVMCRQNYVRGNSRPRMNKKHGRRNSPRSPSTGGKNSPRNGGRKRRSPPNKSPRNSPKGHNSRYARKNAQPTYRPIPNKYARV